MPYGLEKMNEELKRIISKIKEVPSVNLNRPKYVQPEDNFIYRASRILLILASMDRAKGLSKDCIACMDFLLRNACYQEKFVIEYFKDSPNKILSIFKTFSPMEFSENDFNLIRYKNIPWDLRFNDIFYFLYARKLIEFIGHEKKRAKITEKAKENNEKLYSIFSKEYEFLKIFGKAMNEEKATYIISETIPEIFWRENEKLVYK